MAEEQAAPAAEIDVDGMSDEQFAEFKGKMGADSEKEPEKPADKAPEKTDAAVEKAADEQDDDHEPEKDGQKRETVPHAQFHRERERRKAAETAAQTAQATATKAMERMQALLDAQKAPEQQADAEPEIPDPNANPMAVIGWLQQQELARQKQANETREQQQAREQQDNEMQAAIQTASQQFNEAATADPTVTATYGALLESIAREIAFVSRIPLDNTATAAQRQFLASKMTEMENGHIAYALSTGQNVADYMRAYAKTRGITAPVQANKEPEPTNEVDKIAKREQTRLAAQSLGNGGGAVVNTGEVTPEQLLEMSDAEFDAYKKKHGSVRRAFEKAA